MIAANERAAMKETVHGAIADALAAHEGADIDAVLAKLGWLEMLDDEPGSAIDSVFSALGAANATATALDDVVAAALGQTPRADLAVLLPRFAAWDPPGRIDADDLEAQGLATGRAASAGKMLVVCGTASEPVIVVVPTTTAHIEAVRGVDPDGSLRTVRIRGAASGATRASPGGCRRAPGSPSRSAGTP